jgi:beta-galactosidase
MIYNPIAPGRILLMLLLLVTASCARYEMRKEVSMNEDWEFIVDSTSSGDSLRWPLKGLPAGYSRTVVVPHTWNAERSLVRYTGKCWYERRFNVPDEQLSKITRLRFDGVYHDAFIYINGKKAGEHTGSGYNRFFVDISPYIRKGENRLTVCADNSFSRSNIPFMRSYDWACDGGIYRNVYEIMTDRCSIRNIHVTAVPEGKGGHVHFKISFIDPSVIKPEDLKIKAKITEENQATSSVVYSGSLHGRFEDNAFLADLSVGKVNLWHFDSPNLYKLEIKLLSGGATKDVYSTVFGFRTISIENNRYVLNGEPMRLMGVEWMPGSTMEKGMAEDTVDFAGNLKLMKNANCIYTRFHWQQDEYIFDWCDRHGILVQEEIPYWGIWTPLNDTLLPKGFQHLDEMIDAHFNHPSIISWGIGNELLAHEPTVKEGLRKLYNHARFLDSSRLVTYVSNSLFFEMPSENTDRSDATADFDMMMFNEYYSTWYHKSISAIPGELDRIIGEYPGKTMTISEWGLCDPPQPGGDDRRVREMEQQIKIYGSKLYIAGAIYFCLNDYRSQRGEDYSRGCPIRDHGVCDGYRHSKKSYETLKRISSPLEISNLTRNDDKILLTISGKTGIPSYTVRNYRIVCGNHTAVIDELKPGEEKIFSIEEDCSELSVLRPTGFEVLHLNIQNNKN